jgi:hypothetical protein
MRPSACCEREFVHFMPDGEYELGLQTMHRLARADLIGAGLQKPGFLRTRIVCR